MQMAVEFWNIPDGLIKAFYAVAGLAVIIFVLGFWGKIRTGGYHICFRILG